MSEIGDLADGGLRGGERRWGLWVSMVRHLALTLVLLPPPHDNREGRSCGGDPGETLAVRSVTSRRVLDPVSRASEILFGLIMVLTFTCPSAATEGARADVRAVLIGLLGCNLAWAIIDAVMYLMGARGERRLALSTRQAIRGAGSPPKGVRLSPVIFRRPCCRP